MSFACISDSDCETMWLCVNSICQHKDFFPITLMEFFGIISIFIACALATAGGVSGGGLPWAILIILFNFDTHQVAPLNHSILFVSALISLALNFYQKHPQRDAPVIDFNMTMLLLPQFLFGTTLGVILNKSFPQWLILASLSVILCINTYKVWQRGKQTWKQESLKKMNESLSEKLILNEEKLENLDANLQEASLNSELKQIIEEERNKFPSKQNLALISVVLVIIISSLLKGGNKVESIIGISHCGFWFWTIEFLAFVICLIFTIVFAKQISQLHEKKLKAGYQFKDGDIHLDFKKTIIYNVIAAGVGIICGLLGIAGGLLVAPLLLGMGLLPEVAAATNAFIVLFITFCTIIQYFIFGIVEMTYLSYLCLVSVFGSLFGLKVLRKVVDYYQRPSIIVFTILLVLIIATIILPIRGLINLINDINKGGDGLWFQPLCE